MTFEQRMYNSLKRKGLAPKFEHAGIYAILLDREIVYIGKSVNMLQRMAQHYTQLSTSKEHKYKILLEASRRGHDIRFAVLYYASSVDSLEAELGEKEGELIRKYLPPLNTQIPKEENWRQYKVNTKARTISLSEIIKD